MTRLTRSYLLFLVTHQTELAPVSHIDLRLWIQKNYEDLDCVASDFTSRYTHSSLFLIDRKACSPDRPDEIHITDKISIVEDLTTCLLSVKWEIILCLCT